MYTGELSAQPDSLGVAIRPIGRVACVGDGVLADIDSLDRGALAILDNLTLGIEDPHELRRRLGGVTNETVQTCVAKATAYYASPTLAGVTSRAIQEGDVLPSGQGQLSGRMPPFGRQLLDLWVNGLREEEVAERTGQNAEDLAAKRHLLAWYLGAPSTREWALVRSAYGHNILKIGRMDSAAVFRWSGNPYNFNHDQRDALRRLPSRTEQRAEARARGEPDGVMSPTRFGTMRGRARAATNEELLTLAIVSGELDVRRNASLDPPRLSHDEVELAVMLSFGTQTQEIARRLRKPEPTIKSQVRKLIEKSGAGNRYGMIFRLFETGVFVVDSKAAPAVLLDRLSLAAEEANPAA